MTPPTGVPGCSADFCACLLHSTGLKSRCGAAGALRGRALTWLACAKPWLSHAFWVPSFLVKEKHPRLSPGVTAAPVSGFSRGAEPIECIYITKGIHQVGSHDTGWIVEQCLSTCRRD